MYDKTPSKCVNLYGKYKTIFGEICKQGHCLSHHVYTWIILKLKKIYVDYDVVIIIIIIIIIIVTLGIKDPEGFGKKLT